jgi:hypothetical protein
MLVTVQRHSTIVPTPAVGTSEVSATVVGQSIAAAASAPATMRVEPSAIQVSMFAVAQKEESAAGEDAASTRVEDAARSVATLPPQARVRVSEAGRIEEDTFAASSRAMVIG